MNAQIFPTIENLKELYDSELYQNLLIEFEKRSKHKLEKEENAEPDLWKYLSFIQKRYMVLAIPFNKVISEFERIKEELLMFTIRSIDFFVAEEAVDDESSANGEELQEGGVSRTFFLDKFCETYLLNLGEKEQLLSFLKATRMPYAEQYLTQIEELWGNN